MATARARCGLMNEQDGSASRFQVTGPPVTMAALAPLAGRLTAPPLRRAPVDDHLTIRQLGEISQQRAPLCDLLPRHDDDA